MPIVGYYIVFRAWKHMVDASNTDAMRILERVRKELEKEINGNDQEIVLNIFHFYLNNTTPFPYREVADAA